MKRSPNPIPPAAEPRTGHPKHDSKGDSRGEATRDALVVAGLELFAKLGYHAAGSRALAETAGVNQALIGYHFGGKKGLYLAVFEHIGSAIESRLIGPAEAELKLRLEVPGGPDRETLLGALIVIIDRAIELFASPDTAQWAMLIVREQQQPTEAFDVVWERYMSRMANTLCRLVGALWQEPPDSTQVRLTALTILSQPLMFRVAREATSRLLGWKDIGDDELQAIKYRIHRNVQAMLDAKDPAGQRPAEQSQVGNDSSERNPL